MLCNAGGCIHTPSDRVSLTDPTFQTLTTVVSGIAMDTWTVESGPGAYAARECGDDRRLGENLTAAFRQLALPAADGCDSRETGAQWFRTRISDLRCNPDFAATAVDIARSAVHLFEGRYLVNKAMANVARQTVCMAILSSYFGQAEKNGGAFLSSIQTLTSAMHVCSRNTTAAIVALLDRLGLVVRVENPRDRRWLYIQPTEHLVSAARDFQRIFLDAADRLFPSGVHSAAFDRDEGIQERCFAVGLYSHIALHASVFNSAPSRVFTAADGGTILLLKLLSLTDPGRRSGNPSVAFPFDEVGRAFGLSRTHIRRLMRKAENAGLVRLLQKGGRLVEIRPPLVDLFENVVAAWIVRAQLDMHLAMADEAPAADRS